MPANRLSPWAVTRGKPQSCSRAFSLPRFQVADQLGRVLVAQLGITLHALTDDIRQHSRNILVVMGNSYCTLLRALNQAGKGTLGGKRHFAAEQFVENQAQRE